VEVLIHADLQNYLFPRDLNRTRGLADLDRRAGPSTIRVHMAPHALGCADATLAVIIEDKDGNPLLRGPQRAHIRNHQTRSNGVGGL